MTVRQWQLRGVIITGGLLPALLLAMGVSGVGVTGAAAQDAAEPPVRFRESVTLDTDIAVTKKLGTVEDYLSAGQWEQAVDVLREITGAGAEKLVAVSPGRYVNAGFYSNLLLSQLPAEGRAVYRRKTDPPARRWFEQGRDARDEKLLRRVLRDAFAGSFGDDALLLLGEWAWERGELDVARSYWRQLLPEQQLPPKQVEPGRLPASLRYPDSDVAEAEILARLVLCSLAEGNFPRAARELAQLKEKHAEATGQLAGRSGNIVDILTELTQEARDWAAAGNRTLRVRLPAAETFALNTARNGIVPKGVDVGAERWSVPFSQREAKRFKFPVRQPAFPPPLPSSVHPVIAGELILWNDAEGIYARNWRTGKPAWPGPGGDEEDATIFRFRETPFGHAAIGVPRFTLTVHDGKLYARMGSPVTSRSERESFVNFESALVMLDLDPDEGQGKLLVKISTDKLDDGGSAWSFEGSPLVLGERVYVALRRSQPEMQTAVACFDGETGRLLWNRQVCAVTSNLGRWQNLVSHQLLTLAENKLFYSTGLGALAALDVEDGLPLWVRTYESRPSGSPAELSDHTRQGLLPMLYHQGTVFAAPNDSDLVFALDAASGELKWQRPLKDRIRHLLGVGQGNLILSGDSLWGLDVETGRVVWGREATDPEFFGYGRGLLVDESVWWPTRETIEIRSQQTGRRVLRQPILLAAHGTTAAPHTGGNLLIADGYLFVAQADRLVAYWEFAAMIEPDGTRPNRREISKSALPSLEGLPGSPRAAIKPSFADSSTHSPR